MIRYCVCMKDVMMYGDDLCYIVVGYMYEGVFQEVGLIYTTSYPVHGVP